MIIRFKISELAEPKGINTAAELAREAKIGQSTAYALWNNTRSDASYSTLLAIATVLGVSPDDLVEITKDDQKKKASLFHSNSKIAYGAG